MSEAEFKNSDIEVAALSPDGRALVAEINAIVDAVFVDPDDDAIVGMGSDAYFDLVLMAQNRVNALNVVERLFESEAGLFGRALDGAVGAAQRIAYLRAVRPARGRTDEHVDYHRESFFNPDMAHASNVWIPIRNVTPDNSVRFVPGSQSIPSEAIETVNDGEDAGTVKRFTAGHKIGLLYDPKRIVSGVDFSSVSTLYVPPEHIAVFNANLIHGAGVNNTDKIRFSMDFRIIRAEKVRHRAYNFAAGGDYFVEMG